MTVAAPRVAVHPAEVDAFVDAVCRGGGEPAPIEQADALVWTDPEDPHALARALEPSPARWVQLPFAGIEAFVAAGAIDPARTWTCAKGAYGPACAEHALALMLAASRRLNVHVRATEWREAGFGSPERRLRGATVLIVGAGGIGRALIAMLAPMEVHVLAINRSGRPVAGAEAVGLLGDLGRMAGDADYVVLAAALTPETRGAVDAGVIARMRPDAWLINVARGGLVQTNALVEALEGEAIGGAALDVTDPEPLPDGHPLWRCERVIVTPHIANTWDMALPELTALVARNVRRFAAGEALEGVVDPSLGY